METRKYQMGAAIMEALKKSIGLNLIEPECIVTKVTIECNNTNETNKVNVEIEVG